jgi:hypothetical protein
VEVEEVDIMGAEEEEEEESAQAQELALAEAAAQAAAQRLAAQAKRWIQRIYLPQAHSCP